MLPVTIGNAHQVLLSSKNATTDDSDSYRHNDFVEEISEIDVEDKKFGN